MSSTEVTTNQFPTATSVAGTDTVLMNVSNATRKVELDNIKNYIGSTINLAENPNIDTLLPSIDKTEQTWCCTGTYTNGPSGVSGYLWLTAKKYDNNTYSQEAIRLSNSARYFRYHTSSITGFSDWMIEPKMTVKTLVSQSYHHTTTSWENTGVSFTIPTGHKYLVYVYQSYATGRPMGLAVSTNNLTTLAAGTGTNFIGEISDLSYYHTPAIFLTAGTYYIYTKRAAVAGSGNTNTYNVYGIDLGL